MTDLLPLRVRSSVIIPTVHRHPPSRVSTHSIPTLHRPPPLASSRLDSRRHRLAVPRKSDERTWNESARFATQPVQLAIG